ncbi:unnamed protein product [Eruca vesicaria subsp. sativa]|uniref:Maturase K n=1 Tax=Eruca vesicaria subsp. sativa TaxID=29727 RepID=A0ABC8JFP5_ERUVS|nr:unnamed protein product [Eruca vesicaria subsp. sativa]
MDLHINYFLLNLSIPFSFWVNGESLSNSSRVLVVSPTVRKNKFVNFVGEYHLDLIVRYGYVPVIVPRVTGVHMLLDSFNPIHEFFFVKEKTLILLFTNLKSPLFHQKSFKRLETHMRMIRLLKKERFY